MKVMRETSPVAAHRRLKLQFFGFAWSSGPSHVTYAAISRLKSTCRSGRRLTMLSCSGSSDPSSFAMIVFCLVAFGLVYEVTTLQLLIVECRSQCRWFAASRLPQSLYYTPDSTTPQVMVYPKTACSPVFSRKNSMFSKMAVQNSVHRALHQSQRG